MEEKITYLDLAENDYMFYRFAFESNKISNAMCSGSQNTSERYLKHVIDVYSPKDVDITSILRAHSLRSLKKFIKKYVTDFECNWGTVLKGDGYYFSARYPGDEAIIVDKEDIDNCAASLEAVREAVIKYVCDHPTSTEKMQVFK